MTGSAQTFALVELAGMVIGIPAEAVVRVVARPATLTVLPRSHDAIDGVFRDGAHLVAVADLRKWMATPPASAAALQHVMVLCVDQRRLGLAVEAVRGLVRLRAANISRIHHGDQQDGFFHSIGTRDDGTLITLLDPVVLIDQVGAWSPGLDLVDGAAAEQAASGLASAIQALVRIGNVMLGFPATMVGAIVREVQLQPLPLGGALTATIAWRARVTPVIDPARTVLAASCGNALTMILAHGDQTLAFPVDEVLAVRTFQAAQVQDAATAGLDSGVYLGHAVEESGRAILLVDGAALLARYAVPGLNSAGAQEQAGAQARASLPAHIVFDIGQLCAVPMHALRDIVALPASYHVSATLLDGIDGQCEWRGRTLPVIDLRNPQARANLAHARLMVVHHGEREVGLLVKDVVALLPANTGERMAFTMPGGQATQMITVGAANARKSYQLLDVEALTFLAA